MVPCGMRPDKDTNVNPMHRLSLLSIALAAMIPLDMPVFVEPTEVEGGRYFPTVELMRIYRAKYPNLQFKILIGNDLLDGLHQWDDFHGLIRENSFMVYTRIYGAGCQGNCADDQVTLKDPDQTILAVERIQNDAGFSPVISNVSSTEVRKRIQKQGPRAIVGLTPLAVIQYIELHGLYLS